MEELKSGLILKKLDIYENTYISFGFKHFEEENGMCKINYDGNIKYLPFFNNEEDLSIYEINVDEVLETGLYENVYLMFNALNPQKTYQVYSTKKTSDGKYQILYEEDFNIEEYNNYIKTRNKKTRKRRIRK